MSFTVGGAEGYMTAGSYPDDGLGEVFLKMGKQGSTLAGVMDAFSIAISIALQYGVPLETYVQKFTNMRFEPAGMTDDPDIRMAQSILDYIFRRLALDYLHFETRVRARHPHRRGAHPPARHRLLRARSRTTRRISRRWPSRRRSTRPPTCPTTTTQPSCRPGGVHSSAELLESLLGAAGGRPAVHELRHQDAPGRQLLRLRRLRQHQRLQLQRHLDCARVPNGTGRSHIQGRFE